jgi:hypothetical protein
MTHGILRRNKNGIIRKLEIRRMVKVKKQRDVIKIKLRQKGYSKGYQHSRTHKPDESYGENSQQADMCREMYEEEEKEFLKSLNKLMNKFMKLNEERQIKMKIVNGWNKEGN